MLRRRRFFAGDAMHGGQSPLGDIVWLKPDGTEMSDADWQTGYSQSLMVFLNGDAIPEPDTLGRRISDDHFLLMFNASDDPIAFTTPAKAYGESWTVRLDTADGEVDPDVKPWRSRTRHKVPGRSMAVLSTSVVPDSVRQEAERRADAVRPTYAKVSGQA